MISLNALNTAAGFDDPLQMLRACHGKILQQCATLTKLAAHIEGKGCDTQAQQAASGILRYFDTAGKFHHQDEEENLFPALLDCPDTDTGLLTRLLAEHEGMLSAWTALRPALAQLAACHEVVLNSVLIEDFIVRHTGHIAIENAQLLPMAARLLSPQQIMSIGRQMSERRGAKYPD
jgi:hemerythrin-like domain-containing protein